MYIKKLSVLIIFFISTVSYSYSDYTLSKSDNNKVDKAIVTINNYIGKKGEKYRDIIINKIDNILKRKKLSEKVVSIFKKLKKGIVLEKKANIKLKNGDITYNISNIKEYWLGLLNNIRKEENLVEYKYDISLDKTSLLWSQQALKRGYIDHKVDSGDSYYNYPKKVTWMKNNGVICKNIKRATFSESIAWGNFYCKKDNCTDEIKNTMKKSFDFYMAEKGKSYKPHYEAIIHPYFKYIGLGLSIENLGNNRYTLYLTNHYCTENIE